MPHLFSIPPPSSLHFLHPISTQDWRCDLHRADRTVYPVVSLQKWHEIAWTLTADTVLASASLLHSPVHFLFQSMHDQGVPRSFHFQHLRTSIKPFVRCSNHHSMVSPHQNDLRGSPVCGGNELGTVQNKNPSLSDLRLCPNCPSQKCRQVAVGFVPW